MNEEQQRIAIAEACGWRQISDWKSAGINGQHPTEPWTEVIPDYLNDLNAMHEAEKTLSPKDKREYAYQLNGGYYTSGLDDTFDIVHATAAQRAEAFLRTIDKWTTNPNEQ
jgi:hypothetical protein